MHADKAREFFLYADVDAIAEAYETQVGAEPGALELIRDWGIDSRGEMTGGDILVGPARRRLMLPDEALVSLALAMGAGEWNRPAWPAQIPSR